MRVRRRCSPIDAQMLVVVPRKSDCTCENDAYFELSGGREDTSHPVVGVDHEARGGRNSACGEGGDVAVGRGGGGEAGGSQREGGEDSGDHVGGGEHL